jgi:hypothetical protein
VFLGLHLLGDFDSAPTLELICRDMEKWIEYFMKLGREKTMWLPEKDLEREMHDVSLLRGLLESAGKDEERDVLQHNFCRKWSANESFSEFGILLGLGHHIIEWTQFGSFDVEKMRMALSRVNTYEDKQFDVMEIREQLCHYIPIGFSMAVQETLSAHLVYDIAYGEMKDFCVLM